MGHKLCRQVQAAIRRGWELIQCHDLEGMLIEDCGSILSGQGALKIKLHGDRGMRTLVRARLDRE
jgi:hypothetical protein